METLTKPKVKLEKSKRRIYKTSDGVKVPGVTTILATISKPQLMPWCAKEERDGIIDFVNNLKDGDTDWDGDTLNIRKLLPEKYFYETKRDTAASVGTICHFMCECYLKNQEPDLSEFPKEQVSLAENGFIKFLDYWKSAGLTVVHTEYPLVHQSLGYGGTIDLVCKDEKDKTVLLDLKTSRALYSEYFAQLAAYKELLDNQTLESYVQRNIIIRIGKDEANDLEIREENFLKPYMDLFMGALQVYNAQKDIKAIS